MINIFFGFWRKVSVLFLALVILFCYTNLPENIAILHDLNGKPQKFIETSVLDGITCLVSFSKKTISVASRSILVCSTTSCK
jgi:uncharacterized membrane protein YqgA involved in biofilm formation